MVDVYCKNCGSSETYLYAEVKSCYSGHSKVYDCKECHKRTTVLIKDECTQII